MAASSRHPGWRQAPPLVIMRRGEVILRKGPAFVLAWNPPEPGLARDARGVQQQSVLLKEGVNKQLTLFLLQLVVAALGAHNPARPVWLLRCGVRLVVVLRVIAFIV